LRQYFSKIGHKRVEFIAAAHLNHVPFDYKDNKEVKQEQRRFNLDEQIQAKIDFCRTLDANEKPQPKRVYLIGHSIGAYISLRFVIAIKNRITFFLRGKMIFEKR
jgi:predicted alpha/beta hydrolase family esterase